MLQTLILISGVLHLGTLIACALVPKEMNFKSELPKLSQLLQHWVWTAGGYIVLNLVAFGLLSLLLSEELASGSMLARGICGYIAIFWAIRLMIQLFLFNAKDYLRNWFLKTGFHSLTLVFIFHTLVYGYAALFV